jgi:hypothetical protein
MDNQTPNGQTPDDRLLTLLDFAGRHAEAVLITLGQSALVPMFVLANPEGALIVISTPWQDDVEKYVAVAAVKQHSHQIGAVMGSFVAEGWMVHVYPKQPTSWHVDRALHDALPVREQPGRIEIVEAHATDGKRVVSRIWQQVRDKPGGKRVQLVLLHEDDSDIDDGSAVKSHLLDGLIRRR